MNDLKHGGFYYIQEGRIGTSTRGHCSVTVGEAFTVIGVVDPYLNVTDGYSSWCGALIMVNWEAGSGRTLEFTFTQGGKERKIEANI